MERKLRRVSSNDALNWDDEELLIENAAHVTVPALSPKYNGKRYKFHNTDGSAVEVTVAGTTYPLAELGDILILSTVNYNWFVENVDAEANAALTKVSKDFYVDINRTDTYTATGSIIYPYKSILDSVNAILALYTAATDKQTTKYTIHVAPGTYADNLAITTIKHLRIQGIGVVISGNITLTQSPIGGSGQEPYTRLEFIGHDGIRAEKGGPLKISGSITGTRTNDSLTYINFKGCWVTGAQLYDTDGTWVTHYENCRVDGAIDTGTFATADSTVLIETTGWNEFAGAITKKVTFYNLNNVDFYGAVNTTPIFDCTLINTRFHSTVSIVAVKNLDVDSLSYKSLMATTPTLTGMTVRALDGVLPTATTIDFISKWSINASNALMPAADNTNDIGNGLVNPRDIAASRKLQLYPHVDSSRTSTISRTYKMVTHTLTNAQTNVIPLQVPSGAKLISAQLNNDTLIAGVDDATGLTPITTYNSLYSTGATQAISTGTLVAKNTKVNKFFDDNAATAITSAATDVTVDSGAGNKFTAGGIITAIVIYDELTSITNA